jgi:predicted short-subunit dehydrogenase-like oxidoreductase (DUF2520 family)
MMRLHLIGTGNLAYHFNRLLSQSPLVSYCIAWYRNKPPATGFGNTQKLPLDWREIPDADITLLALPDIEISKASARLGANAGLVLHSSGASPLQYLQSHPARGVLYPLQSLSREKDIPADRIPVFVEASGPDELKLLLELAASVFPRTMKANSQERLRLHLAAVIANNFSNYLYDWSLEICRDQGVDFRYLLPLIRETTDKLVSMNPSEAQTGPAVRGDKTTVEKHLDLLETAKEKELYQLLTSAIIEKHEKEF